MRKKCSNIPALVADIRVKCPDLTAETIVNHEAWYKVYLRLREKQRSSVKEWRKRKEMEKMKNREDETGTETLEEISRERRHSNIIDLSTCMMDKCERRIMKTDNFVDINNQKKELIRQWKTERENKRLMDEEQSRNLMESKLAAREKRKRERLKRLREVLTQHREKKLMEVSSEASKGDLRAKYNPMLIKAFR